MEINYQFSRGGPDRIEVNETGRLITRKTRITNMDTLFINIPYWLDRMPEHLAWVRFIVMRLPETTPDDDNIHIAGNFNGWNPGHMEYVLKVNNSGLLEITIPRKVNGKYFNAIEYKFTRGNWKKVETTGNGYNIPNRAFLFGKENVVEITIDGWHDLNRDF
jgi:hypothetical protein